MAEKVIPFHLTQFFDSILSCLHSLPSSLPLSPPQDEGASLHRPLLLSFLTRLVHRISLREAVGLHASHHVYADDACRASTRGGE